MQGVERVLEVVLEAKLETCEVETELGFVEKHRRDGGFGKAQILEALGYAQRCGGWCGGACVRQGEKKQQQKGDGCGGSKAFFKTAEQQKKSEDEKAE